MSHYSNKCSSFIWLKYHYFPVKYPSTLISPSCLRKSLRTPSQKKLGSLLGTIHTQPFLFHHWFEISYVANLPSAALTRGQMAQKFPKKLLHLFVSLTCAVWVEWGAERSQLIPALAVRWDWVPGSAACCTSYSSMVRLRPRYCSLLYQL